MANLKGIANTVLQNLNIILKNCSKNNNSNTNNNKNNNNNSNNYKCDEDNQRKERKYYTENISNKKAVFNKGCKNKLTKHCTEPLH